MAKFGEGQFGANGGEGYAFSVDPVEYADQVEAAWAMRDFEHMLDEAGLSGTSVEVAAQLDATRHSEAVRLNQLHWDSKPPKDERSTAPRTAIDGVPRFQSGMRTQYDAAHELPPEHAAAYLDGKHYIRRGVPPKTRELKRRTIR